MWINSYFSAVTSSHLQRKRKLRNTWKFSFVLVPRLKYPLQWVSQFTWSLGAGPDLSVTSNRGMSCLLKFLPAENISSLNNLVYIFSTFLRCILYYMLWVGEANSYILLQTMGLDRCAYIDTLPTLQWLAVIFFGN